MFKRGDIVEILKQYQDSGDDTFTWVVLNDEEKERVDISPLEVNLPIKPIYTVKTEQIMHAESTPQEEKGSPVTAEVLALEFSQSLRALLTPTQMSQVILRNVQDGDPAICHSHDFCDANVVMHEVFLSHGMDPADEGGAEKWGPLWDNAWNLAKASGFQIN